MRIFNAYKKRCREKQNELERLESQRDESLLTVYIICPLIGDVEERLIKANHDIREFIAKNGYNGKNDYDIHTLSPAFYRDGLILTTTQLYFNFESIHKSDVIWLCDGWEENAPALVERMYAKMFDKDSLNPMCDSVFTYHKLNSIFSQRVFNNYAKFNPYAAVPLKIFKIIEALDVQDEQTARVISDMFF